MKINMSYEKVIRKCQKDCQGKQVHSAGEKLSLATTLTQGACACSNLHYCSCPRRQFRECFNALASLRSFERNPIGNCKISGSDENPAGFPSLARSQRAREPESRNPLSLTRSGAEYDYRVAKDAQTSSEMSPMLLLSAKVSMLLNFFLGEAPTGGFFRNGGSTG